MTGRKCKLNDVLADKIVGHIANGMPANQALQAVGLGKSAYYDWIARGERDLKAGRKTYLAEFSERIKRAESAFIATHLGNIAGHSEKAWQASAWLLERRFPEEFSLRAKPATDQGLMVVVLSYSDLAKKSKMKTINEVSSE